MLSFTKPADCALVVHDACASGASDPAYCARIGSTRPYTSSNDTLYDAKGKLEQLFTILSVRYHPTQVALGTATRKDLTNLYEQHMVARGKPGRSFYDKIYLANGSWCPYCTIGHVKTLDHYLPKSRFPQFSVLPINLVPACRDCQTSKGREFATTGATQTLHPYFDHSPYTTERWLFAKINHTLPMSASFYCAPPATWSEDQAGRIKSHMKSHDLGARFGIHAASELSLLRDRYASYRAANSFQFIAEDLSSWRDILLARHTNNWKTALYDAIVSDVTYLTAPAV